MRSQIEAALKRRAGDQEHSKALTAMFQAAQDLYTFCPHCKAKITGSMQQLNEHAASCVEDLIRG